MHTHGLGYSPEKAQKSSTQTENGVFVYPGGKTIYMKRYEKTKGQEIFDDVAKRSKKFKEGQTVILDVVDTMDTEIKLTPFTNISIEDFILNNVKPVVCLEKDVFNVDYVISDDAFLSKFNAITSDFAYLFDVF